MWDWDCFLNHNNSSENGMFLTNVGSPFHKSQVGWHLTFVPPALLKIIHWVMVHWSLCSFWSLILSNFSHSFHLKSFSNSIQSWVQCPKLCKNVDKKKQRVTSFKTCLVSVCFMVTTWPYHISNLISVFLTLLIVSRCPWRHWADRHW